MSAQKLVSQTRFRVIDALDAPHVGKIIRLRLQDGPPPRIRDLKGAALLAESPKGEKEELRVLDFAHIGGRPSDSRLARTGRADLVVVSDPPGRRPDVATRWTVTGPV